MSALALSGIARVRLLIFVDDLREGDLGQILIRVLSIDRTYGCVRTICDFWSSVT